VNGDREIWLIRHAESEWNALGRWQGQADPVLSARGRDQAASLAARVARERFDALVTSDLRRARETAEVLGRTLGLEPRFDARLRERHIGAWAGLTSAEIGERWPDELARVRRRDRIIRPGGGESMDDVAARARACLLDLAREVDLARVAIVAHGGVIRSICDDVGPLANADIVRRTFAVLVAEAR
jgi:broad specificity phosphatase PhoE